MSEKPSTIVQENINALIERERAGRIEHGGDLDRQDLPVMRWLEELRCESLDSANYATKLMHLLPKLLAAVAVLERTGFTWAGDEWKSGAAQEAVAWQYQRIRSGRWIECNKRYYEHVKSDPLFITRELVERAAIPVTAAPTLDAELAQDRMSELCALERDVLDSLPAVYYMDPPDGGDVSLGEQVKRMAEDAALWRKHSSTPAAPGIDLEQFREAVQGWRDSASNEQADGLISMAEWLVIADRADRLLALIDASHKGGSDATLAYWRVTFRMYRDDPELCVLFVGGQEKPTLDSIGVTPRPIELVNVEPRFVEQNRLAAPSIEATPSIAVDPSTEVTPLADAARSPVTDAMVELACNAFTAAGRRERALPSLSPRWMRAALEAAMQATSAEVPRD